MINRIRTLRILPRWLIIIIDLLVIHFSVSLGYLVRFNFDLVAIGERAFFQETGLIILCSLAATLITRSYSGIIRYTGVQDAIRIVYTMIIAVFGIFVFELINFSIYGTRFIPISIIAFTYFASVFFLIAYRLIVKSLFSYYSSQVKRQKRVLIYGAGHMGRITKQVIDHDPESRYKLVGFIDDDRGKYGKTTDGLRIFSSNELAEVVIKYGARELILAIRDLDLSTKNRIVDSCLQLGIKISQVPEADQWVQGELSLKQIKEVNIDDLLGREAIVLNNIKVGNEINDRCVLITGAAGSIGSEMVRQILRYAPSYLILIDQSETGMYHLERELEIIARDRRVVPLVANITNSERMEQIFKKYRPDLIYHAAAYKHVPVMEKNPIEAVLTNVLGTKVLADMAHKFGVKKFVMISTDKAVNPTNVMGASKRIAEMYVQALDGLKVSEDGYYTKFITTRFGNVLGSNGSVIPLFKEQIANGGPVTVTHPEISRYFMTIPESCELVLEAGAMGDGGEIYLFDMGESIRIVDLAKKMIRLSGLEAGKDIEIQFTGLRDGEKLYEELLCTTENSIPTYHEKIMIAKVVEVPFLKISKDVETLIELIYERNELEMVSKMKEIVPEFRSNSSRFEILDKKKVE